MNTTWTAMLDVWRAADQLDVFESGWNFDHFEPILLRSVRAVPGGMVHARGDGPGDVAAAARVPGDGDALAPPLGPGQHRRVRLPPLKERMDQFEEGVQVVIALLSEDRASFAGQHFVLDDAWCEPKPVPRPHPPIAIGGNGERRTLRVVARYAQHWNSTVADAVEWRRKCDVLEQHCADVGRDPSEIERSVNVRLNHGQDPREIQPIVAGWRDAGADVCIVCLNTPHDASVMEPPAAALRELG